MKTVVLCGSTVFYDHIAGLADELEQQGFGVVVPIDAEGIRKGVAYDSATAKTWYDNPADFHLKAELMRDHLEKIAGGDMILVVNDTKHGVPGYIGPNVLIEMGLAFYLHKPIYVLNTIDNAMPVYEEVMGMEAVVLAGDITKMANESE